MYYYFLPFSRRLYLLNKLFVKKVDINLISFQCKSISNQVLSQNVLIDTKEWEKRFKEEKERGGQTTHLLKSLLFSYTNKYDYLNREKTTNQLIVSRVKQIAAELKQTNSDSNDAINSALMEFFTNCGDLESALEAMNRISINFRLDSFKIFNLSTLLVKSGKTNAAINLIESQMSGHNKNYKNFRDKRRDFTQRRDQSINKLLNTLIDKQIECEIIEKVFQMCIQMSPTKVNKTIAGPLIRMHLVTNDFRSALNKCIFCAQNYGIIPWSLELMRIFIKNNDQKSLETIVKYSSQLYGPNTTALDLSAAYLYNGSEDKAKQELSKISNLKQKSIELVCDKFIRDERLPQLKSLILMTQSIDGIDRHQLFSLLITAYKRNGLTNEVEEVLTLMKEHNIEPKEHLNRL